MRINNIRKQFPILSRKINGKPLIYFDTAATALKPKPVIEAITKYYSKCTANIHRGIHTLAQEATAQYESARKTVQKFINAKEYEEIIFTSGATESINLVARTFGEKFLKRGDEILVSEMEHHSNFVPWQVLAERKGLKLKFIPVKQDGSLDLKTYQKLLGRNTKLVAVSHVSNVLGVINPIKRIIKAAHKQGARVLIDAAQSAPHLPLDVQELNCDFLAFSGHKLMGPTGIGVLYGKKDLLSKMPPYKFGGHMVAKVTKEKTTYAALPHKFEAGTAPIAQAIGLAAAIRYLKNIGFKNIQTQEKKLVPYALRKLTSVPGLKLIGPALPQNRISVFSFTINNVPPHDIATLLDQAGIAVRAGHHCAQILHRKFGLSASVRASLYFYNTSKEINQLANRLKEITKIFNH